jgi:peptidoglycan/LPS O-acetylase OafA/YrhL
MYLALPFIYMLLKRIPSTVVVLLLWFAFFAAVPSAPLLSSFPCFMGGVLAYQLAKERVFRLPSYGWPIAILGLSALNIVASLTIFPDYRADYLLCMLLGLIIPSFLELSESWITNVSRIVARYSYGIYLWHEPAVWLSFVKLKSFPIGVKWAVLVLLIVCVPLAAYHWLEAPLIRVGRNLATRWTAAYGRSRASRHGTFQEPSPQLAD